MVTARMVPERMIKKVVETGRGRKETPEERLDESDRSSASRKKNEMKALA